MVYDQKANLRLFLFIVVFSLFAFALGQVLPLPVASGAPRDAWSYLEGLAVFQEAPWSEDEGDLPVTREEAARFFYAAGGGAEDFEAYYLGLIESGIIAPGAAPHGGLTRAELCLLLERLLEPGLRDPDEEYYVGAGSERARLNLLARLGVIEVPADRVFRPEEAVSRREFATSLAAAAVPALRASNPPMVVQPRQRYTYATMVSDLQRLAAAYPEVVSLQVIGESVEGRRLYAARLGRGETEIFLDAAIHASEWLTTPLLMKMLEEYAHHAAYGITFGGYRPDEVLADVTLWFMPMLNPDGVTLVLEGPEAVENGPAVRKIQQSSRSAADFSDWKANIRGVDLNRQFPVNWHNLVQIKRVPAPSHHKGSAPLTEPEARALYEFTLERRPAMTLSFHQRGEFLVWYYRQRGEQFERDRRFAREIAKITGYSYDFYLTNGGKYHDWVITELGVPAMVIEVGQQIGDLSEWDRIWRQNRYVGLAAAKLVLEELRGRE